MTTLCQWDSSIRAPIWKALGIYKTEQVGKLYWVYTCLCLCLCVFSMPCAWVMRVYLCMWGSVSVCMCVCVCVCVCVPTVLHVFLLSHTALGGGPLVPLLWQGEGSEAGAGGALAARRLRVLHAAVIATGVLRLADHGEGHPARSPLQETGCRINHPEIICHIPNQVEGDPDGAEDSRQHIEIIWSWRINGINPVPTTVLHV